MVETVAALGQFGAWQQRKREIQGLFIVNVFISLTFRNYKFSPNNAIVGLTIEVLDKVLMQIRDPARDPPPLSLC